MKSLLIGILLLVSLFAFGQSEGMPLGQNPPDSGFTNKAEAKNLIMNGFKQGKWMQYLVDDGETITRDSTKTRYYQLGIYRAGNLNGLVRIYQNDGELHSMVFYCKGKREGDCKFYDSGQVVMIMPYLDGKETGVVRFYDKGFLQIEIPIINGIKNGVEKMYYESGKIMCVDTVINDKMHGTHIAYYENGKIMMEVPRSNDKPDGWKKTYYESGKMKSETMYTEGKEEVTKNYDENGNEIK